MQFEFPNCYPDANGIPTKTCHCADQAWLLSWENPETLPTAQMQAYAQSIQNAYG